MKFSAHQFARAIQLVPADDFSAAAEVNGTGVDTQGYNECLIVFDLGTFTATGVTIFTIQDSADNTTFADVTLASGAALTTQTASTDATTRVVRLNLSSVRRYIRIQYDVDTDNCTFGVTAILLHPKYGPAAQVNALLGEIA